MVKDKKVESRREIISLSFPPELACHIRRHENMSSYIRNLVIKDIKEVEQQSIVEQIRSLLNKQMPNTDIGLDVQLNALSAIDSLIGE